VLGVSSSKSSQSSHRHIVGFEDRVLNGVCVIPVDRDVGFVGVGDVGSTEYWLRIARGIRRRAGFVME